jgi:hypothetical protein
MRTAHASAQNDAELGIGCRSVQINQSSPLFNNSFFALLSAVVIIRTRSIDPPFNCFDQTVAVRDIKT